MTRPDLRVIEGGADPAPRWRHDPAARGFHAVYRPGETNRCPGCGRKQWLVGRSMAECAFCASALPIATEVLPND